MSRDTEYIKNILFQNKIPDNIDSVIYDLKFNISIINSQQKINLIKQYLPENKWLIENKLPQLDKFTEEELIKFFIEQSKDLYPFTALILNNLLNIDVKHKIDIFLYIYDKINNIFNKIFNIIKSQNADEIYYFIGLFIFLMNIYNICITSNTDHDINILKKIMPSFIDIINNYKLIFSNNIYNTHINNGINQMIADLKLYYDYTIYK